MRDQFPFAVARVTRRWRKMLDERLKDLGSRRLAGAPWCICSRAVKALPSANWPV